MLTPTYKMDQTADTSTLPVDFEGSLDPSRLPEITLGNHTFMATTEQTTPLVAKTSGDRLSPVRGRTMKEYDQQISDLKKENFSLKMRIYYMEERMQQRFGDGQDVFKTNIELQVEIENLKRELSDKQVLVQKAALAMETLTAKHEQKEESIRNRLLLDYKKEVSQLRDQLDMANKNCERSHKDIEDAERQLRMMKEQLGETRTELADSHKTNEDLSTKVKSTEFEVQTLTDLLKLSDQTAAKLGNDNLALSQKLQELEDQLQDACKDSVRKDRDIQNLSTILQDQSHVDCTSLLQPVHFQDEFDDQKSALIRKDGKIADMEKRLNDKEGFIEELEKSVSHLQDQCKDAENRVEIAENELVGKNKKIQNYKRSIEGLVKSLQMKSEECKDQKMKLEEATKEVKQLEEALNDLELHRTKALSSATNQLAEADTNNKRLMHQLTEANETAENLLKSLGKKEGELAGFQDQLRKAMDAMSKSEEAVEALQAQLKRERAEFEARLRDQAVHFKVSVNTKNESVNELEGLRQQIVDLQKLIASQNVELLALARDRHALSDLHDRMKEKHPDIQLSSEHERELSEPGRELQTLRATINSKNMKIQALENDKVWLEDHQREAAQRLKETWNSVGGANIQDLSLDLLQDIKMLMDLLRREISSLATLHLQLREFDTSEHGLSTETLVTEISSVQRIYKQLEVGVEKNSRLHQVLLHSLKGEQRLSDSPDSNSCQDGGYNLGSTHHQTKHPRLSASPDMKQNGSRSPQRTSKTGNLAAQSESLTSLESEWESPPASQSVAVETCPELVDRSLQTGNSFSHIDQWVQTSPRVGDDKAEVDLMGSRGPTTGHSEVGLIGARGSDTGHSEVDLMGSRGPTTGHSEVGLIGARGSDTGHSEVDLMGSRGPTTGHSEVGLIGARGSDPGHSEVDLMGSRGPTTGHSEVGLFGTRGYDTGHSESYLIRGPEIGQIVQGSNMFGPVNNNKVLLVDSDDDVGHYIFGHHNNSLTDDAKEEHLGMCAERLEDYHNFQHGVFFDEHHVEPRRHDQGASMKDDSKWLSSPSRTPSLTSSVGYINVTKDKTNDAVQLDLLRNDNDQSPQILARLSAPNNSVTGYCRIPSDVDEPDGSLSMPSSSTGPSSRFVNNCGSSYLDPTRASGTLNADTSKTRNPSAASLQDGGSGHIDRVQLTLALSPVAFLLQNTQDLSSDVWGEGKGKPHNMVDWKEDCSLENTQKGEEFIENNRPQGIERGDSDEWSGTRIRCNGRNSWAEELEQYRVHEAGQSLGKTVSSQRSEGSLQPQCHHCRTVQHSPTDQTSQNIGMSPADLTRLVTELQIDLVNATAEKRELQKQLEAAKRVLGEQRKTDPEGDTEQESATNACIADHHRSNEVSHMQDRRSRIPRPHSSSSSVASYRSPASATHENINSKEPQFGSSQRSEGKQIRETVDSRLLGSFECPDVDTTKATSADTAEDIHSKLNKSYDQIRKLEGKLLTSEKSVQHLSKQNQSYLSTLEAAGISLIRTRRPYTDNNLDSPSKSEDCWASCGENQSPLFSERDGKDNNSSNISSFPGAAESMERARSHFPGSSSQFGDNTCHSQPPSIMTTLSVTPILSPDATKDGDSSTFTANSSTGLQEQKNPDYTNFKLPVCGGSLSQTNDSVDAKCVKQPGRHLLANAETWPRNLQYGARASTAGSIHHDKASSDQHINQNLKSSHQSNQCQDSGDQISPTRPASQSESVPKLIMETSVLDHSSYPDVTYTSMLDNTIMHKLLSNLDNNMSAIREEAFNTSNLSVDQLQIRVEHLERVNLTLREEIGVYEALHRSQGTQVSPSLSEEFGGEVGGQARDVTDEDLLKQHLIEIRKLRQRLERLDVTKDPDQLLIFQSHTQQRIVRQEMMISHLQHQMVEKDEQWQRELAELQHKLSREKALLVEKLQVTISELSKTVNSQSSKIDKQRSEISDLISELNMKEECEKKKEEELKKVVHEKAELETDLLKRDKEFLNIEKNLFGLEMAKENSEAECKKLYSEMEEKDKDNGKLRQLVEETKENSKSLKETVVKYEKSLQEKVFNLQKLTNEKAVSDHRMVEKDGQVKKLETELVILRRDTRAGLEEREQLKAEIDVLSAELKKKDSLEAKCEFQKVGYVAEIERISEEKIKLRVQLESKIGESSEMKRKIEELEQRLLGKAGLEKQVYMLKEENKVLARLQDEVDRLHFELDGKAAVESELKDRLKTFIHLQTEVSVLREKLFDAEGSVRLVEEDKKRVTNSLAERDEKLKKRDKQLHHLLGQYKKLDTAFTKQKYSLNEKLDLVQSLKKQMHLYEVTLTCASQEEKDNIMKQLLKELIATQRQVEDLLSRLEQNSAALKPPFVVMEGFNYTSSTTDMTTATTTATKGSSHHDLPSMAAMSTDRDDIPDIDFGHSERLFDEFNHPSELERELRTHSHSIFTTVSANHLSPHHSNISSQSTTPNHSPRRLKYFAESDYTAPKAGNIPQGIIDSDIRNLFAVLKLESHEKLRKETGECLVILSGMEARLGSRLRVYKSQSVSESIDYSTMRETSMACQNLRMCLEEASRLTAAAWITELPPVDTRGHFYDPVLAEQNENLKSEMAQLCSRNDLLDRSLKEQQASRLNTTSETSRQWENSLYKQLHKTSRDLEQAKENIDTSLTELPSPRRYHNLGNYSPQK